METYGYDFVMFNEIKLQVNGSRLLHNNVDNYLPLSIYEPNYLITNTVIQAYNVYRYNARISSIIIDVIALVVFMDQKFTLQTADASMYAEKYLSMVYFVLSKYEIFNAIELKLMKSLIPNIKLDYMRFLSDIDPYSNKEYVRRNIYNGRALINAIIGISL